MKLVFFRLRGTEKIDSVMKGLIGAMPPTEFLGGNRPASRHRGQLELRQRRSARLDKYSSAAAAAADDDDDDDDDDSREFFGVLLNLMSDAVI